MFGSIGGSEILLILLIALLVFGPRRLPEMGRTIGRTLSQFRRAATDFKHDLEREVHVEQRRDEIGPVSSVAAPVGRPPGTEPERSDPK